MPFDAPYQTPFGDIELLTDARSRISNRKSWVQGRFQDGDRYCLVAVLSLACGSRSFHMPNRTEKRLARLIAMQIQPDAPFLIRCRLMPARHRLMSLNDDPRTTHEDVIALFDRTISRLASTARVRVPA
jgi:hypothetical protein